MSWYTSSSGDTRCHAFSIIDTVENCKPYGSLTESFMNNQTYNEKSMIIPKKLYSTRITDIMLAYF